MEGEGREEKRVREVKGETKGKEILLLCVFEWIREEKGEKE